MTSGEGRNMGSSTRIIRAALLAAAAVALAAAAYLLREKHQEAEAAVEAIQDQLDALDPATRAAVIARLTSDEVKRVKGSGAAGG
jgi:predicted ATPase